MQFVRAPDENVYIAPFNLVEIVISALFEWWMPKKTYELINDWVMAILYSPLLVIAAIFETRTAYQIRRNRARGEEDDDVVEEWEEMTAEIDFESEGWSKTCDMARSNVEEDAATLEVRKLRDEVDELKAMLASISKAVGVGSANGKSAADDEGKGKERNEDAKDTKEAKQGEASSSSSE